MYELLIDAAQAAITRMDAMQHQREADKNTNPPVCIWRGDPHLSEVIGNIKIHAQKLAADCTKVTILGSKNPSAEVLGSLIGEMMAQLEGFTNFYFDAFAGGCSLSYHLFVLVTAPLRQMLSQLVELATELKNAQFKKAPHIAGAITETANITILKSLPATNKVAYRRALMSAANSTKDIIAEFGAYITKSAALIEKQIATGDELNEVRKKQDEEKDEDEDEDDDEMFEDFDEGSYTPEELLAMRDCMCLLDHVHAVVRLCLDAVTEAADSLTPLTAAVVAAGGGASTVFDASLADQVRVEACQAWVARIIQKVEDTEVASVSFGAELYSPLEDVARTYSLYNGLRTSVSELIALVTQTEESVHERISRTEFRSLLSAATNTGLDDQSAGLLSLTCAGLSI